MILVRRGGARNKTARLLVSRGLVRSVLLLLLLRPRLRLELVVLVARLWLGEQIHHF